jgi:hypothetical protein
MKCLKSGEIPQRGNPNDPEPSKEEEKVENPQQSVSLEGHLP